MNNEEIIKQIRESVEKQVLAGRPSTEVVHIFLQLQLLDKLDEVNSTLEAIDSRLTDIDSSLTHLDSGRNPL